MTEPTIHLLTGLAFSVVNLVFWAAVERWLNGRAVSFRETVAMTFYGLSNSAVLAWLWWR